MHQQFEGPSGPMGDQSNNNMPDGATSPAQNTLGNVLHNLYRPNQSGESTTALTPDEILRLSAVRAQYQGHPSCVEQKLDERRLSFAKWLVDKGQLSEDLEDL